jgi:hypothetical protein
LIKQVGMEKDKTKKNLLFLALLGPHLYLAHSLVLFIFNFFPYVYFFKYEMCKAVCDFQHVSLIASQVPCTSLRAFLSAAAAAVFEKTKMAYDMKRETLLIRISSLEDKNDILAHFCVRRKRKFALINEYVMLLCGT